MATYEWLVYKDKKILHMEITLNNVEDLKKRVATIEPVVEKEPPKSILCICNLTGGMVNPEITQTLTNFMKHNEPYMKVTAITGIEGPQHAIFKVVSMLTDRKNFVLKESREEALNWLIEQK
jgi:hypothetical protein